MKASASVELLEHAGFRAVARATVEQEGLAHTAEATLDLSDGSELATMIQARGGGRLERFRSEIVERVRARALHVAREALREKRLPPDLRAERDARGPEQPRSPRLARWHEEGRALWEEVERVKRER